MPNSGFCCMLALKTNELQDYNSDFSFREESGNGVGIHLFVEIRAVF